MDAITILLDHERNLQFQYGDLKELCRIMTRLEPGEQPRKVTTNRLWQLLAERDPEATVMTLFQGLKWEDRTLKAERMEQILSEYVRQGGDLDVVYDRIVEAMEKAGLVKLPNRSQQQNGASGNGVRVSGS